MTSLVTCMTAVHPLDMVRGQMTTSPGIYTNWYTGLKTIYQRDGIKGLYKGGSHSASWAAAYYGVQFFSYDTLKVGSSLRKVFKVFVSRLSPPHESCWYLSYFHFICLCINYILLLHSRQNLSNTKSPKVLVQLLIHPRVLPLVAFQVRMLYRLSLIHLPLSL